jgi:hypothetical protein
VVLTRHLLNTHHVKKLHSNMLARLVVFLTLMACLALLTEYDIAGKLLPRLLGLVFLLLILETYCRLGTGLVRGAVKTVEYVGRRARRVSGSGPSQDGEMVPATTPEGRGDEPTPPCSR